jgi:heat shock protein HslJ
MHSVLAVVATAVAVCTVSTGAEAQARRGNADQQATSGQAVKKREEKKFPLGASWIAVSINGKPFNGSERPAFTLDDRFRVRGFGGCNSFSTSAFPLREQGIAVGPLAITQNTCDKNVQAAEMQFLTALRTSAKWDTDVGALIIKGPNGELKFERSL